MDDYFWYDGVRSDTVGIRLQGPLAFSQATPKMSTVTVPGRNGDLHYWEEAYSNVTGTAKCFALEKKYVDKALGAINRFSLMNPGYHRLETKEEPEYFRMAAVVNGPETEIRMRVLAPFSISFDCMPQKFFKSGETPIKLVKSGSVLFNEGFPSAPKITITGSGAGEIAIDGRTIELKDNFSGELTYDSDTQNAYYMLENRNNQIYAPEQIILPNGRFEVNWSGGVESVIIIPNWWTL